MPGELNSSRCAVPRLPRDTRLTTTEPRRPFPEPVTDSGGASAMTYVPDPGRYDAMRYRRVGRSGLLLPAVSLGLWQNFGHDRPLDAQRAIVRRAFDRGVTHFDL